MCVSDVLSFMTMDDLRTPLLRLWYLASIYFLWHSFCISDCDDNILCQDSAEGENRYGASPKYEEEPPCVPPEERKE